VSYQKKIKRYFLDIWPKRAVHILFFLVAVGWKLLRLPQLAASQYFDQLLLLGLLTLTATTILEIFIVVTKSVGNGHDQGTSIRGSESQSFKLWFVNVLIILLALFVALFKQG